MKASTIVEQKLSRRITPPTYLHPTNETLDVRVIFRAQLQLAVKGIWDSALRGLLCAAMFKLN